MDKDEVKDYVQFQLEALEKRLMQKLDKKEEPSEVKKPIKKKKDPNAPKKPLSAFVLFSADRRVEIKKENPEITFVEMSKKLGEDWKAISSKEKEKYIKKAEEAKEKYKEEMKE